MRLLGYRFPKVRELGPAGITLEACYPQILKGHNTGHYCDKVVVLHTHYVPFLQYYHYWGNPIEPP